MAEESKLQAKVLRDLRSMKKYCECFKLQKASDDGNPDIFFTTALTGAVFLEMKSTKGDAEPLQKYKIKRLTLCGSRAFQCNTWKEWIDIKKSLMLHKLEMVIYAHEQREKMLSRE